MGNIVTLKLSETLPVDLVHMKEMYNTMGAKRAEDALHQGFERLAQDLGQAECLFSQSRFEAMRKPLNSLKMNGAAVGLSALSQLASNVLDAIDMGDLVAVSATLMRCLRNSEPLLTLDTLDKSSM